MDTQLSDMLVEFGKGNPCHVSSGAHGGEFCSAGSVASGGGVAASAAKPEFNAEATAVTAALRAIPEKFRVASPTVVVTDLQGSTLLTRKLIGIDGATDINSGKIEIFARSKSDPRGVIDPSRLSAVAVHEYGHAVDGHLGQAAGVKFASSGPEFVVALAKDYQSLGKAKAKKQYGYLGSDAREVFAEAFSLHASGKSYLSQTSGGTTFASDFANVMGHVGGLFK